MQRFVPPLLDRLIDAAPQSRAEPLRPSLSLEQLKDAVARDVESLLNARRGSTRDALDRYPNARASVAAFGLDDFASMSMASTVDRAAICRAIERSITDHEPRLRGIRVDLDNRDAVTQKLRFAIHAMLVVHPLHEQVNFDAVLQTTTQNYAVQCGRRAA
jgi:type VI secretion system protein ImpF